jgi:hypothetical protein
MRPTRLIMLVVAVAMALLAVPAVSQARDRDHDGLPDKWEKQHHLSTHKNSANADADRDRVDNGNEFRERTNPRRKDSNRNGRPDGREDRDRDHLNNAAEDATGNDPVDKDTDNDGIPDGKEQAGVVTEYDTTTGALTINLSNGGSVTAKVTDNTEIECETENEAQDLNDDNASASRHGADDAPGDDRGGDDQNRTDNSGPGNAEDNQNGDDRQGRRGCDEAEHHCGAEHGDRDHAECPPGTLKVGARIHEAEAKVTSTGAEWVEIEVLNSTTTP